MSQVIKKISWQLIICKYPYNVFHLFWTDSCSSRMLRTEIKTCSGRNDGLQTFTSFSGKYKVIHYHLINPLHPLLFNQRPPVGFCGVEWGLRGFPTSWSLGLYRGRLKNEWAGTLLSIMLTNMNIFVFSVMSNSTLRQEASDFVWSTFLGQNIALGVIKKDKIWN